MWLGAFGPALGMICLSCISIVPIEEEPSSPPSSIKAEPEHKKAFYVHTVKWGGETVSIIAAWYTGDHQNWKALAQANPQIDPNLIREGDKILIPEGLLRTREPLPKEFVERFYLESTNGRPAPRAEDTWAQEQEPKLFGPKKYPAK